MADIKALAKGQPGLLESLEPAFKSYNEEQYTTVKLPGSIESVRPGEIITSMKNHLTPPRQL